MSETKDRPQHVQKFDKIEMVEVSIEPLLR
jgi:hypothetical protein